MTVCRQWDHDHHHDHHQTGGSHHHIISLPKFSGQSQTRLSDAESKTAHLRGHTESAKTSTRRSSRRKSQTGSRSTRSLPTPTTNRRKKSSGFRSKFNTSAQRSTLYNTMVSQPWSGLLISRPQNSILCLGSTRGHQHLRLRHGL